MAGEARGTVKVNRDECKGCGLCVESCTAQALELSADLNHYGVHTAQLKGELCSGCGICYFVCPEPGGIQVYRRVVEKREVSSAAAV